MALCGCLLEGTMIAGRPGLRSQVPQLYLAEMVGWRNLNQLKYTDIWYVGQNVEIGDDILVCNDITWWS